MVAAVVVAAVAPVAAAVALVAPAVAASAVAEVVAALRSSIPRLAHPQTNSNTAEVCTCKSEC